MSEPINTCYLVARDGTRIPISPGMATAIKKFVDNRLTGSVTISFKSGGIASVEDRTVYQN